VADGHGLARGFERLARERGYRDEESGEESGEESLARVVAMARPLRGAREAVALAVRSGKHVVAVSRAEHPGALYGSDGEPAHQAARIIGSDLRAASGRGASASASSLGAAARMPRRRASNAPPNRSRAPVRRSGG
jgi:hypothetical protein